jgi:predicted nucleic acid-binding protein
VSAYLDASTLVPTLVEEDATGFVQEYLRGGGPDRVVSDFAAAEVASAISRLVRMRFLDGAEASARLADFDAWRAATSAAADVHAADARLAYAYVRRFDLRLRAPDAMHLAIAYRLGATIVTLDRRLANAAGQLGIAVELLQTK